MKLTGLDSVRSLLSADVLVGASEPWAEQLRLSFVVSPFCAVRLIVEVYK